MSKSIYRPYFYIIQHISSGKYYAGVKHGKNANPDQLLKSNGYQTSSKVIQNIILEEGLESFIIRKIKIFDTGEEALDYESRFLRRVNAAFNDSFLNRSNNSISTLNIDWKKLKQTCLERYGFECSLQNDEVKEKIKQTMLESYGCEYPLQSEEIREKKKQTNLERYGVETVFQNEEIQEKIKQANLERYGVEYIIQHPEIKDKTKQTNLQRYGVENPGQNEEIKYKIKQAFLKNLGVEHPSQSDEVKEKKKQTCLKNRGVEFPMQSEEVKEKRNQNNLEKYGVENPSSTKEVREKVRLTCNILSNRPIVLEIRKYKDKFKLKLGCNWSWKKEEILGVILEELKITYGEIY